MKVNIIKFLNNFNSYLFELKKSKKIKIFTLIKTSGIYDPYLSPVRESKKIITIGLAYSFQKVKEVPINKYDIKLDFVITEKEN